MITNIVFKITIDAARIIKSLICRISSEVATVIKETINSKVIFTKNKLTERNLLCGYCEYDRVGDECLFFVVNILG